MRDILDELRELDEIIKNATEILEAAKEARDRLHFELYKSSRPKDMEH